MATIGPSVPSLIDLYRLGGRQGGCTTRRKKTFRKTIGRHPNLIDLLKPPPLAVALDDWRYAVRICNIDVSSIE